jgi:hypothetical protein
MSKILQIKAGDLKCNKITRWEGFKSARSRCEDGTLAELLVHFTPRQHTANWMGSRDYTL